MSEIRPARELRHAKSAGEGFVNSTAFEWLSRAGFVARGAIYAIIGVLALQARDRRGRQADEPAGRAATRSRTSRSARSCSRCSRSGSAATRCGGSFRAALGHGPEGSDSGFERLAALASGLAYGALCVLAVEILIGSGASSSTQPEELGRGVLGWPGGTWIVGAVGAGDDRRRALPGLPGHHAEVPRGLEDRGDEPGCPQVDRTRRDGRPSRADGRLRPDRHLPRSRPRSTIDPNDGGRARRRAGEARRTSRTARCCSASSPPA